MRVYIELVGEGDYSSYSETVGRVWLVADDGQYIKDMSGQYSTYLKQIYGYNWQDKKEFKKHVCKYKNCKNVCDSIDVPCPKCGKQKFENYMICKAPISFEDYLTNVRGFQQIEFEYE